MDLSRKIKKIAILADNYYKFALIKFAADADGVVKDMGADNEANESSDQPSLDFTRRLITFTEQFIVELVSTDSDEIYESSDKAKAKYREPIIFRNDYILTRTRELKTELLKLINLYVNLIKYNQGAGLVARTLQSIKEDFLFDDDTDPAAVEAEGDIFDLPLCSVDLSYTLNDFLDEVSTNVAQILSRKNTKPETAWKISPEIEEVVNKLPTHADISDELETGKSEELELKREIIEQGKQVYEKGKPGEEGQSSFDTGSKSISFSQHQLQEFQTKKANEKTQEAVDIYSEIINVLNQTIDTKVVYVDKVENLKSYELPRTKESFEYKYKKLLSTKNPLDLAKAEDLKVNFQKHISEVNEVDMLARKIAILNTQKSNLITKLTEVQSEALKSSLNKTSYPAIVSGKLVSPKVIYPSKSTLEDLLDFTGDFFSLALYQVYKLEVYDVKKEKKFNSKNYRKALKSIDMFIEQLVQDSETTKIRKLSPIEESTIKKEILKAVQAKKERKPLAVLKSKEFKLYRKTIIGDLDNAGQKITDYFSASWNAEAALHIANKLTDEIAKDPNSKISKLLKSIHDEFKEANKSGEAAVADIQTMMDKITEEKENLVSSIAYMFGLKTMKPTKLSRILSGTDKFDFSLLSPEDLAKLENVKSELPRLDKKYNDLKNSKRTPKKQVIRRATKDVLADALSASPALNEIFQTLTSIRLSVSEIQRIIKLNLSSLVEVEEPENKFDDMRINPSEVLKFNEKEKKREENIIRVVKIYSSALVTLKELHPKISDEEIQKLRLAYTGEKINVCYREISRYMEQMEHIKQDLESKYLKHEQQANEPEQVVEQPTATFDDDYNPPELNGLEDAEEFDIHSL